ncbi:MAG: oligosaccharide flippase family protein [Firmicutes bacterium]|nr:oligosaccharide flippase family protein [Bacillota bacterium]
MRDIFFARHFGLTPAADAFTAAFFAADFAGNTVMGAVLSVVTVTFLTGTRAGTGGDERRARPLAPLVAAVSWASALLAASLAVTAPLWIRLVGASLAGPARQSAVEALRWLSLHAFAAPLSAVLAASLQVSGRFALAAAAPLWLTAALVSGPLIFGPQRDVPGLAAWVAGGSLCVLGTLAAGAVVQGSLRPRRPTSTELRDLAGLGAPIAVWYVLSQAGQVVDRTFAGGLGSGQLAALTYAWRFAQAPVWIFAAAVGTVLFPSLARRGLRGDVESRRLLDRGVRLLTLGAVPLVPFWSAYARPVLRWLLAHGVLTAGEADRVAGVLAVYAAGLPAAMLAVLFFRALMAAGRLRRAAAIAGLALCLQAAGDAWASARWGLAGIAGAGVAVQWLGALLAGLAVAKELGEPALILRSWLGGLGIAAAAALPPAAIWLLGARAAAGGDWGWPLAGGAAAYLLVAGLAVWRDRDRASRPPAGA